MVQSDVFVINGDHARKLMSAAGFVVAQVTHDIIPEEPTLWLTVEGNGDSGLYKGPYGMAVCGGCSETQLVAFQSRGKMWHRVWDSIPMAGNTELVTLSDAHGQQGIVTRIDSLSSGETYFNGQTVAVVPGDMASYTPARPTRVWQWYKHTLVVGQIGLTVTPIVPMLASRA